MKKSNVLNQRFFSHSEEDIRISQSEAFSSGGPIREKIDKRTFTLVWTLGFLGRLIGRLRYEVRFCTIRDDTDLLESFFWFETGMHGPETAIQSGYLRAVDPQFVRSCIIKENCWRYLYSVQCVGFVWAVQFLQMTHHSVTVISRIVAQYFDVAHRYGHAPTIISYSLLS